MQPWRAGQRPIVEAAAGMRVIVEVMRVHTEADKICISSDSSNINLANTAVKMTLGFLLMVPVAAVATVQQALDL